MLPEPPRAAAPSLDTIRAAIQRDEVPELDWPWRAFRIGVVGEGFINDDGTSRQEIIAGLHAGDGLELVCEPNNRYDKLAVKVCTLDHEQIGYLPAGHGLSLRVQNGRVGALIYRVTGGTHERPSRGVVALILEREA